jgi:hypothetical protein
MADNIVAGLFGLTPQMYGEQQRTSALAEGIRLAQLSPEAAGAAMTYAGARGLGGAIAGALGAEDPQLKLISARNSIFQQIDQSNPESMMQGIKMLSQMGDNQGAMALADYYRSAQNQMAQTQQRKSAALASEAQATRERQQATPNDIQIANRIASLKDGITQLEAAEQTPENNRTKNILTYQLAELERITDKTKQTAPNVKTVGVAEGTKKAVFLDVNSDQQFTYEIGDDGKQYRKPYVGRVDRVTSKTEVGVKLPEQEKSFESGLGTGQSKKILEDKTAALDASAILETNQVAKNLLKSGVITGTGANFFVGLNSALQQAGLDFGYADAASNSQAYVSAMGANVGRLIKQFGAGTGLSNADREYAEKMAGGQITLTESALRKIIDINDRAANRVIDLHNRNVKDIKTNIPLTVEKPTAMQVPKSSVEQIPTTSKVGIEQERQNAKTAIAKGADAEKVRERFRQKTNQEL